MTNFTISITSDTVCPWCYIGYRNLQSAISQHISKYPSDTFTLSWQPFQLSPHAPRGQSIDKTKSYESKFGVQQAQNVFTRIRSAGETAGVEISFGGRTGNTLDSHRVIEFAREKQASSEASGACVPGIRNLQTRVVEELFGDYFERERDITSHAVLAAAARRAGVYEKEVVSFLAGEGLVEEVVRAAEGNREGVNGVPQFTINDVFTVEGAQEPQAFLMLFERFKKKFEKGRGAAL